MTEKKRTVFNGLAIEHCNIYNDRPTIVFLHDSLGCIELWRDWPYKLAEASKCNVLIYDRLGYGKSESMLTYKRQRNYLELEADVLNELLTMLAINDAILFGHSDGGSIALIAAGKYAANIKAVICEAAHIFVEDITLKGIHDAIETYNTTSLPERLQKYHGNKVEAIFKAWTETWTNPEFRNWSIEHLLADINCPLLFIQGEADEYGTLAQVDKTIIPVGAKAEKFVIPNIGHTPHKEAPELTMKEVKRFIDKLG